MYIWIFSSIKLLLLIIDLHKYFLPPLLIVDLHKYFLPLSLIVDLYKHFLKTIAYIKCLYYLKVCETTHRMTKYFSIYKSMIYYTISCQIWHQVLVIPKAKATVLLIKQMLGLIQVTYFNNEKRLINKVRKIDAANSNNIETVNKVVYKNVHSIIFWSKSEIQSPKVGLNGLGWIIVKKNQARKLVKNKDVIVNITNILGNANNCLLFKNNIE